MSSGEGMCVSTTYLLGLMLSTQTWRQVGGAQPEEARCCLWLLRCATSHPWTVCGHRLMDGLANRSRQGITWSPLKQGWKADITCILSTTLKPGSDCNVLPANDPTTACNAVLRWYWLNYTVSFELNNLHEKKTTDVSPSAFLLIGKSQLQLVNNPTEKLYHGVAFLNHSLFILKSQ